MSALISSSSWWNDLRMSSATSTALMRIGFIVHGSGRRAGPRRPGGGVAGDQVAQAGADDGGVVGDALERPPTVEGLDRDPYGIGPVDGAAARP